MVEQVLLVMQSALPVLQVFGSKKVVIYFVAPSQGKLRGVSRSKSQLSEKHRCKARMFS